MATTKEEIEPPPTILGLEYFDNEEKPHESNLLGSTESSATSKNIDLEQFLAENYGNKIIRVHKENFDATKRPIIISFHHYKDKCVYLKYWIDKLHQEALKYEGSIQFAIADSADVGILQLRWNVYHGYICCDPENAPEIYAIDAEQRKYACIDQSLSEFSEKLCKGELYCSEELPASNEELVKVGVARNFATLVRSAEIDVFVSFYATWSCISKQLLPQLNELAELLKHEDVLIVKMDAEANYVPLDYCVFNYPKMFLIPRGDKSKYVEYVDGPITLEKLVKFIAVNATMELKAYDREGCRKTLA